MKSDENYDPYRDSPHFIKECCVQAFENMHENPTGRVYDFHRDMLFHIASKGKRSRDIVWRMVRKHKVTVLRASNRPNLFKVMQDEQRQSEKRKST